MGCLFESGPERAELPTWKVCIMQLIGKLASLLLWWWPDRPRGYSPRRRVED